jgi:hypothetical protein
VSIAPAVTPVAPMPVPARRWTTGTVCVSSIEIRGSNSCSSIRACDERVISVCALWSARAPLLGLAIVVAVNIY